MLNFDYSNKTRIVFGRGTETQVGSLVKPYAEKVLLHYGGGSIKKSGLYDRVAASLRESGVSFVELGGVQPNPRLSLIHQGIELCRREGIGFILAVGGGSVIDSAKAIAMGVPYDGDVWDFFATGKPIETALPVATILTLPATGSEASDGTVVTNEEAQLKLPYGDVILRPVFSIMNPELYFTLPENQVANGVCDMMSHIMERYFTNTTHTDVTDGLCESVLRTIMSNARILKRDHTNYDAWAEIALAGTVAHNGLLGLGREEDWGCHNMEHELSAIYDVAHGAGLAVIMPAWMRYCADHHDGLRMAQMAVRVFGCQMDFADPRRTALEGIAAFRAFLKSMGMPLTFAEIGADPADIPKLVEMNHVGGGITGGYVGLTSDAIREIYEIAAGLRD